MRPLRNNWTGLLIGMQMPRKGQFQGHAGAIPTSWAPRRDRPTGLLAGEAGPIRIVQWSSRGLPGRRPEAAYCTAFIMSKIGRYIATTMPPTMTPRTTIITGSISESRADTATSTSSS